MPEPRRRVENVLYPVDYSRLLRTLGDVHNPLEAQQIRAAMLGQCFEKERQRDSLDRLDSHDCKRFDLGVMGTVIMLRSLCQPRVDVERSTFRIVWCDAEEIVGFNPTINGARGRRPWIKGGKAV